MSNAMLEGIAILEADRWGDTMQTWSFPELEGVPLGRCGLNTGDEQGLLRFWQQGSIFMDAFSEKVGKALEFTNADAPFRRFQIFSLPRIDACDSG